MNIPVLESAANRYCRLLPPSAAPDINMLLDLSRLGKAMTDDGTRVSEDRPEILMDVGYTYFGQFLDHDLTKDQSSLEDAAKKEPENLENFQRPRLDLSHLYGDGPGPVAKPDDLYQVDRVKMNVGPPIGANAKSFDVYVDASGAPVLGDSRSGENVIIRQITAVFTRLHNSIVNQLPATITDPQQRFEAAKRRTTWHFQWLVVKDFLETALDSTVVEQVKKSPACKWNTFSIPIEFAVAGMRFGHSMVRSEYRLSLRTVQDFKLGELFGLAHQPIPLPGPLEIQWGLFFQGAGEGGAITSRPVDARISAPLHKLPDDLVRLFNAAPENKGFFLGDPPQLPVRTLIRGARLRLPSGQEVAKAFAVQRRLTAPELTTKSNGEETEAGKVLKQRPEWLTNTPLWYYILKEAEVIHNGSRLGPTGSHIVAETIFGALRSDPDSYFNHLETKGAPPTWPFPSGPRPLYGLSELFRLAPELG
jgi:hypothetical protein